MAGHSGSRARRIVYFVSRQRSRRCNSKPQCDLFRMYRLQQNAFYYYPFTHLYNIPLACKISTGTINQNTHPTILSRVYIKLPAPTLTSEASTTQLIPDFHCYIHPATYRRTLTTYDMPEPPPSCQEHPIYKSKTT